jgi:hypothetical protein
MSDAVESRKRAEECRQLAAMTQNADDKAFWLRLAEDWSNIALTSENVKKPDDTAPG